MHAYILYAYAYVYISLHVHLRWLIVLFDNYFFLEKEFKKL